MWRCFLVWCQVWTPILVWVKPAEGLNGEHSFNLATSALCLFYSYAFKPCPALRGIRKMRDPSKLYAEGECNQFGPPTGMCLPNRKCGCFDNASPLLTSSSLHPWEIGLSALNIQFAYTNTGCYLEQCLQHQLCGTLCTCSVFSVSDTIQWGTFYREGHWTPAGWDDSLQVCIYSMIWEEHCSMNVKVK